MRGILLDNRLETNWKSGHNLTQYGIKTFPGIIEKQP
jgi:hypothetical protein